MAELHDLSALDQAAAIASKELSSRELVAHYLDRIDCHDQTIGAFITVFAEEAADAAAAADAATVAGGQLGLLHGLPLALKDLHYSAGLRTTFGCAVFKDLVPPIDAPAIGNLRAAGAVVIGKTNVPEFGPTCYTDNAIRGATVTPYGAGLSASGSSGGSAAAVAAGFVGLAHGSDGLGSIRTPAANCGLVGFKPSRGRVAGSGLGWLALAVEGPLARSVGDAALFLDSMGSAAPSDLWRSPDRGPDAFRKAVQTPPAHPLRIVRMATMHPDVVLHPECSAALDRAVDLLSACGHELVDPPDFALPDYAELRQAIQVVLASSIGVVVEQTVPPESRELLMPYTKWLLEINTYTATELARAHVVIGAAAVRYAQLMSSCDLLVSPTTTAPPLPTNELRGDDGRGSLETMSRWSANTPAANIAGAPAVSLPVHQSAEGMPIGIQLAGRPQEDELALSCAAQLEEACDWPSRHPPIWYARGQDPRFGST